MAQDTVSGFILRTPNSTTHEGYTQPPLSFLNGKWHVTHSTLPMWKSKRNVSITYNPLPPSDPSISAEQTDRLDDLVEYQPLTSDKVSSVHGIDKAADPERRDAWDWRGKGWLMIASSHWQVLGWGKDGEGNEWAVTFFAKTLFTPAGIDFYSRSGKGLAAETASKLEGALGRSESEEIRALAKDVFSVKLDAAG